MSNGKRKGNKNERELTKYWQDWTGLEFSRVPQSGGLRWQNMEHITGDIICTDPLKNRRFPFSIETKFHRDIRFEHLILGNKKQKIMEFWEQAVEDGQRANRIPLLFMRYNGMPKQTWFVVISEKLFKLGLRFGLKNNQRTMFTLHIPEQEALVVMHSDDFSNIDYKEFTKTLKKKIRHGDQF